MAAEKLTILLTHLNPRAFFLAFGKPFTKVPNMGRTRVFVSSTCYDLAPAQEDIRRFILQLGHEPVMSEYPWFPVNPDETTSANCRKSVDANTDVMLLIVGGQRGALDTAPGKSVTNLEYEAARAQGIPCFIFVSRPVLTLLAVWRKNRAADFAPTVDYPEVFDFIERIQAESRWAFPFDKTAEIQECFSFQLSTMLRELLTRRRAGTLDPVASYAGESQEAQRLVRERPKYWEYLLSAELLKTKLAEVRRQFERLKTGLVYVPLRPISAPDFFNWNCAKMEELLSLTTALQGQLQAIQESWGPPGTPGDVEKIRRSIDDFVQVCNGLLEWERDLRSTSPPEPLRRLKETMQGWTESFLQEMERLPVELLLPFKDGATLTGKVTIRLTLEPPPFDNYFAELNALKTTYPSLLP